MYAAGGARVWAFVRYSFSFFLLAVLGIFLFRTTVASAGQPEIGAPEIPVESQPTPTPTPVYTPTPTPPPTPVPKTECVMFVTQRGPGWMSRWDVTNPFPPYKKENSPYSNVRYPSHIAIWFADKSPINPTSWQNYFYWSTDFKGPAGWRMTDANWNAYMTHSQFSWTVDPCNRYYTGFPACKSNKSQPPTTISYDGQTYTIIGANNTLGGECTLLVGGQTSPLVIDLKGKGVKFTSPASPVAFQLGGESRMSNWIANGADVAFLALDTDDNGVIDNGSELFGNSRPSDGSDAFGNGFAALAAHDRNHDQMIDENDTVFNKLLLWYDANANGRTERGELVPVRSSAIRSIDLHAREVVKFNDNVGNLVKQEATIALGNGSTALIYDAWFAYAADGRTIPPVQASSAKVGVPGPGTSNYSEAFAAYRQLLKSDNWSEAEFPFESGKVEKIRDTEGNVAKIHASWKHVSDDCRANVHFKPDWSVLSSRVDCSSLDSQS